MLLKALSVLLGVLFGTNERTVNGQMELNKSSIFERSRCAVAVVFSSVRAFERSKCVPRLKFRIRIRIRIQIRILKETKFTVYIAAIAAISLC